MLADHAPDPRAHQAAARVATVADFFFVDELAPYDPAELIPQKGDAAMARTSLLQAPAKSCPASNSRTTALEAALRAAAAALGIKAGQMFQPIRVAVCGRKMRRRCSKP